MFLGIYRFNGNVDELLAGYRKMMELVPPGAIHLHVCVQESDGLSIIDTCPTREAFENFAGGEQFRGLLKVAGLPMPSISAVGEIYSARNGAIRLV